MNVRWDKTLDIKEEVKLGTKLGSTLRIALSTTLGRNMDVKKYVKHDATICINIDTKLHKR